MKIFINSKESKKAIEKFCAFGQKPMGIEIC